MEKKRTSFSEDGLRRIALGLSFLIVLMLTGCSDNEELPQEKGSTSLPINPRSTQPEIIDTRSATLELSLDSLKLRAIEIRDDKNQAVATISATYTSTITENMKVEVYWVSIYPYGGDPNDKQDLGEYIRYTDPETGFENGYQLNPRSVAEIVIEGVKYDLTLKMTGDGELGLNILNSTDQSQNPPGLHASPL